MSDLPRRVLGLTQTPESSEPASSLNSAQLLAALGLRVFPVIAPRHDGSKSDGKIPAVKGWNELATCSPEGVRALFAGHASCNIGIATGGGIVVLDVDTCQQGGHRADGGPTLSALEVKHGPLPATLEVITGSGGRQLYLRLPEGIRGCNSAGKLGPGLDVRGDGGFVVAPPSLHANGKRYVWAPGKAPNEVAIADAPSWLVDLVSERTRPAARVSPVGEQSPLASAESFAAAEQHLKNYAAKNPTAAGNGNDDCCKVGAILLHDWALTLDEALPLARRHNLSTHNPRSEEELLEALTNGAKYAKGTYGGKRREFESARRFAVAMRSSHLESSAAEGGALEPLDPGQRTTILVGPDEAAVGDAVIAALAQSDPDLYEFNGTLGTVSRHEGTPRFVPLRPEALRSRITRVCNLVRPTAQGSVPIHPPGWLAPDILSRARWPGVRQLTGILEAPTLRPNGSLLSQAGYDSESGLLLMPGVEVQVPEGATQQEAAQAMDALKEVVQDFPFAGLAHLYAWIAMLFTMLARSAIDGCTPLFLLDASTPGSGKSLLADAASVIASGRQMPRRAYSPDEEEQRKSITTLVMDGARFVLFDNIKNGSSLGSPALDSTVTGRSWNDRILGKNQSTGDLPIRTIFLASGNNLALAGDLHRRVLHIRLASPVEKPESRSDLRHPDLLLWIADNRERLLGAALTVLRGFINTNSPGVLHPWGSFTKWSALVRGAVVWAGGVDPFESRATLVQVTDSGTTDLAELMAAMRKADPQRKGLSVAELIRQPAETRKPLEALVGLPPERTMTPTAAGKALSKWRDRVVNGARLRSRMLVGVTRWYVEEVTP